MKNNQNNENLLSIDEYIERQQIGESELKRRLVEKEVRMLCWVTSLPVLVAYPLCLYKSKDSDGVDENWYIYQDYSVGQLVSGLIEADIETYLGIMQHGDYPIAGKVSATNTGIFSLSQTGIFFDHPDEVVITLEKLRGSIENFEHFGVKDRSSMGDLVRRITGKQLPAVYDHHGRQGFRYKLSPEETVEIKELSQNVFDVLNDCIDKYQFLDLRELYVEASLTFILEETIGQSLDDKYGPSNWRTVALQDRISMTREWDKHNFYSKRVVTPAARYVANRSDLVITSDVEKYFVPNFGTKPLVNSNREATFENGTADDGQRHIRLSEEVYEKYWRRVDPSNPNSYPDNDVMIDWLISERGIRSANQANNIINVAKGDISKPTGRPKNK